MRSSFLRICSVLMKMDFTDISRWEFTRVQELTEFNIVSQLMLGWHNVNNYPSTLHRNVYNFIIWWTVTLTRWRCLGRWGLWVGAVTGTVVLGLILMVCLTSNVKPAQVFIRKNCSYVVIRICIISCISVVCSLS